MERGACFKIGSSVKNPFDSFWQNSVPKWHEIFRPNFKSSRLQNSPYFCVFNYARAVKQKFGMRLKTESETGERRPTGV